MYEYVKHNFVSFLGGDPMFYEIENADQSDLIHHIF